MRHIIFGESHGPAIGVTLEGAPSGVALDWDFIRAEMARRAPGGSAMSTARKEADEVQILSGVFEGKTTGTPLCAVISNTDTRSGDYAQLKALPRPGHADYSGGVRYGGLVAGPARTDGKVVLERWVELQSVSVKSSAFDVDAMTVTTPSMVIPIAENVMCYNETTGSWYQVPDEAKEEDYVNALNLARAFSENVTIYYDKAPDQGGKVRIVVVG